MSTWLSVTHLPNETQFLTNEGTEIHRPVTENQVVKMSTSFFVPSQGLLKIRCRDPALDFTRNGISGSKWPTEKAGRAAGRDSQISACQLARCRSAEDAVLCPSDMMLCDISYWVLSGAKWRQIQQLRCCVLPGTQGSAGHERIRCPSVGYRVGQVSQDHADPRCTSAGKAAETGRPAQGQGAGQGESTRFRSATAEPLAGRTGTKQTSGTTPHTGGALGNLNLIGRVRSRKLALSAPAPGYKELEVQVKEVCVCEAMKSPVGTLSNGTVLRQQDGGTKSRQVPIWQKSNLTLEEAAAYSGIGINKLRSMTDSDECKFVLWNGTKRLIKRRKLDEYLDKAFSI